MRSEVRARGEWPGRVELRKGWALARARPWNDDSDESAALRLERGGDRFLQLCASWLTDQGAREVLSPALPGSQRDVWRRAGFAPALSLLVFERRIGRQEPEPLADIVTLDDPDLADLARVDDAAFDRRWRVGRLGLVDALEATAHAVVFAIVDGGTTIGFVIVGETTGVAYLQRLAVDPDHGGRQYGRSLVRAAIRWASRVGARTMLLNTQPDNQAAAALYRSEGFRATGSDLHVLAWTGANEEKP